MNAASPAIDSTGKLIDARIADAQESLVRIQQTVDRALTRRRRVADAQTKLATLNTAPFDALSTSVESVLSKLPSTDGDYVRQTLQQFKTSLQTLKLTVADVCKDLEAEKSCCDRTQIDQHAKWTKMFVETKHDLLADLRTKTTAGPWERLKEIERIKPFWSEHIEIVAGLVLRDDRFDGFEGKLCLLSDELVQICQNRAPFNNRATLNILGREQSTPKDLLNAVYFRFPAWSVWALPFTAHEFWHAAAHDLHRGEHSLGNKIRDDNPAGAKTDDLDALWKDPVRQDCMADVFGVHVIGPAYAYTAILLSLDPFSDTDRQRAEAIFAALDSLSEIPEDGVYYSSSKTPDLKELRNCWTNACRTAGSEPADSSQMVAWARLIAQILPWQIRYKTREWAGGQQQWVDGLGSAETDSQKVVADLPIPDGADIRHALHAGWVARWRAPENSQLIAARVYQFCLRIKETNDRARPSTTAGPRNENADVTLGSYG